MFLQNIKLINFRNYSSLNYTPVKSISVIYGKNGSGKTNLLEAVHFCCVGRSHRTHHDRDMIKENEEFASTRLISQKTDGRHDIQLKLNNGTKISKRVFVFEKQVKSISEMMGHATCVLFSPDDPSIVKGGPQSRRRFVDMQLSQIRKRYFICLSNYYKSLKNRNALLKSAIYSGKVIDKELDIWDEQLAIHGAPIIEQRKWFFDELNKGASKTYANICGNSKEILSIQYENTFTKNENSYEAILKQLFKNRNDDKKRGFTNSGPHRDDFSILLNNNKMSDYASQGQIRSAVLSLKISLIDIVIEDMGESPILLLDDVFSELDTYRREALLEQIKNVQTFLTCTDKSDAANAQADEFIYVECNEKGEAELK